METKRIVLKNEEEEFIDNTIRFVTKKGWTIQNLNDATKRVVKFLEKNAVIKEELTHEMSALKKTYQ